MTSSWRDLRITKSRIVAKTNFHFSSAITIVQGYPKIMAL